MTRLRSLVVALGALMVVLGSRSVGRTENRFPSISQVNGYFFDERTGVFLPADVFARDDAPRNRLGAALLAVVTLDLGAECVSVPLSGKQANAVARGESSVELPSRCVTPVGSLSVAIAEGKSREKRQLALRSLAGGPDGKVRVPMLVYRTSPCEPLELRVTVVGSGATVTKRVNFECGE